MPDNDPKPVIPPSAETVGIAAKPLGPHPAGNVRYSGFVQFTRICSFTIWFLTCVLFIGAPLYFVHRRFYYAWMARTKQHFGVVVTTITQWWSPTVIRVTGDRTVRDQIKRTSDGGLECRFPDRLVLIANHQLYSDWLYLWWIAYTARMHGFVYIILKESLKWEQDKSRLLHRLSKLASGRDTPMWLLIFPEGTNLSINGRRTSTKYAEKLGMADVQHQLLPRSTGLRFCLEQMKGTVDWVYDCTVAYEGVPIYFTLYSTFFQGRPPKSDIPLTDSEFELWLRERWIEKDDYWNITWRMEVSQKMTIQSKTAQ
ncbi:hypothetical protein BDD12DRAFT_919344 [Trichophaea hybrida]|nr:hypothetical protein BDD12DRAFT_919344 [Trichophaea hybrida]